MELTEVRELLKRSRDSVKKVHAMVRGEYSELHVGYRLPATVEILRNRSQRFKKLSQG
jgi:hypothetical protein